MPARILVAEDEPHIVECLAFLLNREGYEMNSVNDGLAALESLKQAPPDLLILDVMLPEMNGFDVLRRVRERPETRELPVLVLTAKGQDADRARILALGANEFITKPFSNSELIRCIRRMIDAEAGAPARRAAAP